MTPPVNAVCPSCRGWFFDPQAGRAVTLCPACHVPLTPAAPPAADPLAALSAAEAPAPPRVRRAPSGFPLMATLAGLLLAVVAGGYFGWRAWRDAEARAAYREWKEARSEYIAASAEASRSLIEGGELEAKLAGEGGDGSRVADLRRRIAAVKSRERAADARAAPFGSKMNELGRRWEADWVRLGLPLGRGDEPLP